MDLWPNNRGQIKGKLSTTSQHKKKRFYEAAGNEIRSGETGTASKNENKKQKHSNQEKTRHLPPGEQAEQCMNIILSPSWVFPTSCQGRSMMHSDALQMV